MKLKMICIFECDVTDTKSCTMEDTIESTFKQAVREWKEDATLAIADAKMDINVQHIEARRK